MSSQTDISNNNIDILSDLQPLSSEISYPNHSFAAQLMYSHG
jgi:hypothetical protein